MPGEPAVDQAYRCCCTARPGARQGDPRCGSCRSRRGEGAPARLRRRAPGEAGRPVPVALSGRSARRREDVAVAACRRGARAGVRVGGLRDAGGRVGTARRPVRSARANRRGAAARRRPQPGVRPRRDRLPGRGRRRGGGAARSARPGAGGGLPRPLSRPALRPVRGALRGHRRQSRFGAVEAAGTDGGDRAVRVHRGREAGHRDRAPVAAATRVPRTDGRSGPHHRRGGRGRHPRLYPGGGGVGPGGDSRRVVRQGGAPACRGARAR